jgi:hypothetical protein
MEQVENDRIDPQLDLQRKILFDLYHRKWLSYLSNSQSSTFADFSQRVLYAQSESIANGIIELLNSNHSPRLIFRAFRQVIVMEMDKARPPVLFMLRYTHWLRAVVVIKKMGFVNAIKNQLIYRQTTGSSEKPIGSDQLTGFWCNDLKFNCTLKNKSVTLSPFIVSTTLTKKIVGWALSIKLTDQLAINAFKMALHDGEIFYDKFMIVGSIAFKSRNFKCFCNALDTVGIDLEIVENNDLNLKTETKSLMNELKTLFSLVQINDSDIALKRDTDFEKSEFSKGDSCKREKSTLTAWQTQNMFAQTVQAFNTLVSTKITFK